MNTASKLGLGIFAAIGIFLSVKIATSLFSLDASNICNEYLSSTYPAPGGENVVQVIHKSCTKSGSISTILLNNKSTPDEFFVLYKWKAKDYETDNFTFFPPPMAVRWYRSNEVHIVVPFEAIVLRDSEERGGVRVKYFSFEALIKKSR
jgi:hypothetical protein